MNFIDRSIGGPDASFSMTEQEKYQSECAAFNVSTRCLMDSITKCPIFDFACEERLSFFEKFSADQGAYFCNLALHK